MQATRDAVHIAHRDRWHRHPNNAFPCPSTTLHEFGRELFLPQRDSRIDHGSSPSGQITWATATSARDGGRNKKRKWIGRLDGKGPSRRWDAVHGANTVLGLNAMRRGDIEQAKQRLLASS